MKFISTLSIFLLLAIQIYTQEQPPIITYPPEVYQADNQNWMLSQDANKYVYIANNAGLLEFSGSNWTLYPTTNGSIVRSVKVIGDKIYTGCYMEFGYWQRNEYGVLTYTSLLPKLKEQLIDDEQFWNIVEIGDWVLFQSLDRIYIYNSRDESFNIVNSQNTRARIFNVDSRIFFQQSEKGIFSIENGSPVLISDKEIFKSNVIAGVFQVEKRTLFLTEDQGFYYLDEKELNPWNIEADNKLSEVNIYTSIQLTDGSFVLGTISNGIYHIDKNGRIINTIDKEKGLHNNTVLSLFLDEDENLWTGLDNGISIINLNSPFSEFIDLKGEIGNVYASKISNGNLYIGTNQGLFYKKQKTQDEFQLIEKTQGQVWSLIVLDDTLFCGHNNGTYTINGNKAKLISDFPGTWTIKRIENHKNLLIQGNYEGLSILEKINNQWRFKNKIEGFEFSSRFFEFLNHDEIILNNEYKGLFQLKFDSAFTKVTNITNKSPLGSGSSLINYNNRILYTANSDKRVYSFNKQRNKYELDTFCTNTFYTENDKILGILVPEETTNSLWGFSDKNLVSIIQSKLGSTFESVLIPVPKTFRRSLGISGFETLSHIEDNQFLIGASDGYTILNTDKIKDKAFQIKINSILKYRLNGPKTKVSLKDEVEFEAKENNLNFSFSVADYDKYTEVYYQYQLLGMEDQWSEWFSEPNLSFENLKFGEYHLKIRAKLGHNISQNTEEYAFQIKRPWYYSNLAILCYALLFITISFVIHQLYKNYYKKQQKQLIKENNRKLKRKKLKTARKIVELENEKLQQDINSKNRELAISTMSILKKNEFLNAIKDQLKDNANIPAIRSVIKTINQNINNSDDWKFFEEAFNNADKDFLKRIKSIHDNLTPNDLKLCAYLRLNLSSKEIAPLLNISVRSVEVKRYRLRKKMALPRENSLTDYIINL